MNDDSRRCFLIAFSIALILPLCCSSRLVVAEEPAAEEIVSATLKVASISFVPKKWNKEANAVRLEKEMRRAVEAGAELVITPEGMLEGYVVNEVIHEEDPERKKELTNRFQELAEPIDGKFIQRFQQLAIDLKIYLILGFLEADSVTEKTFNTAALFDPDGKLVGKYHKTHFHQGYEVNPPGYTAGSDYPVFSIHDPESKQELKVGMMICFDRQLPEPARQLTLNGADLIACPSYGSWGDWNTRLMQVRAYENQAYVVFSHPNQSLLIDRDGEIMQEGAEDSFAIMTIDLDKLKKTRRSVRNRRPETYREANTP
ncbi:N-carbamoyl-D-amino acid hydrolase [Polystyrenella longa]|uniref:N-carbamoyl-D-amino acid hydrolase n=1 Tax=Polystyrenella longa TaxID=2528007 RepID=A0A518CJX3_9PLAN|nr:carbon-nitrogen hydrolase family protein [Polystyrenella longa]QDU79525.1 N-carbamoyl-D-amino acid hydrolase [Polystyrenella longa]